MYFPNRHSVITSFLWLFIQVVIFDLYLSIAELLTLTYIVQYHSNVTRDIRITEFGLFGHGNIYADIYHIIVTYIHLFLPRDTRIQSSNYHCIADTVALEKLCRYTRTLHNNFYITAQLNIVQTRYSLVDES